MDAENRMLTVEQVAEHLAVNAEAVRRWLRAGELRGVRLGGTKAGWRVAAAELRRFLEERAGGDTRAPTAR